MRSPVSDEHFHPVTPITTYLSFPTTIRYPVVDASAVGII